MTKNEISNIVSTLITNGFEIDQTERFPNGNNITAGIQYMLVGTHIIFKCLPLPDDHVQSIKQISQDIDNNFVFIEKENI